MIGFWIFLIVLLICVTVIICFAIYNTEALDVWKIQKKIDEMDKHIVMIAKMIEKQSDEKEGTD